MRHCRQSSFYASGVKLRARDATWTDPTGRQRFVVPGRARVADEVSVHDLPPGAELRLVVLPRRCTVDRDGRRRPSHLDLAGIPPLTFDPAAAWGRAGQRTLDLAALEAAAASPAHFAALLHHAAAGLGRFAPGSPYATALADAWLVHAHRLPSPTRTLAERLTGVFTHCSPSSRRAVVAELVADRQGEPVGPGATATTRDPEPATPEPRLLAPQVVAHLALLLTACDPALRVELLTVLAPHLVTLEDDWGRPALEHLGPVVAAASTQPEAVFWRGVLEDGAHGRGMFANRRHFVDLVELIPAPGTVLSPAQHGALCAALVERSASGQLGETPWGPGLITGAFARLLPRLVGDLGPVEHAAFIDRCTGDPRTYPLLAAACSHGLAREFTAEELLALQRPLIKALGPFDQSLARALPDILAQLPAGPARTGWVRELLVRELVEPLDPDLPQHLAASLPATRAASILTVLPRCVEHLDEPGLCELLDLATTQLRGASRTELTRDGARVFAATVTATPLVERAWQDRRVLPRILGEAIRGGIETRADRTVWSITSRLPMIAEHLDDDGLVAVVAALDEVPASLGEEGLVLPLRWYGRLGERLGPLGPRVDRVLTAADRERRVAEGLVELLPELAGTLPVPAIEQLLSRLLGHAEERVRLAAATITRDVVAELDLRRVRADGGLAP